MLMNYMLTNTVNVGISKKITDKNEELNMSSYHLCDEKHLTSNKYKEILKFYMNNNKKLI